MTRLFHFELELLAPLFPSSKSRHRVNLRPLQTLNREENNSKGLGVH
jgi:hypothetical protein